MDQSETPSNRRNPRSQLLMKASVEVGGRQFEVKLRNLSTEGALIESDFVPVEGTEILFRKGSLSTPGRVAWATNGRAGIAFSEELEPETVARQIPPAKNRPAGSEASDYMPSALSEQARQWVEKFIYQGTGKTG